APPAPLSPEREAELLRLASARVDAPLTVLGVDSEGVDLRRDGRRERHHFGEPLDLARAQKQLADLLVAIG
ncbi:MAG: hypothetical protein WCF44_17480, partial [Candidatus Methylophosphatis roskildensis]